ncbi:hypothetical protein [Lacrimispora sp. JR3]|uniref:hypothetical protein n=1 Tax=Lacrimispora sinapis TaxID=3111456 RepID=UPI0037487078
MRRKKASEKRIETRIQETGMEDVFSRERMLSYLWIIFFPPYGLYRVWNKASSFRRSEKWVWTMMIMVSMITFLKLIITG